MFDIDVAFSVRLEKLQLAPSRTIKGIKRERLKTFVLFFLELFGSKYSLQESP